MKFNLIDIMTALPYRRIKKDLKKTINISNLFAVRYKSLEVN